MKIKSDINGERRRKMDEIAVLIPCFNEEITVGKVVRDFKRALPQATVYVYDNNSTDKTVEKAKEAGAIVRHEYQQGKGNVVRRMFQEVEAQCYILVDADDTYPASEAAKMTERVLKYHADMVVGDRLSSTYFKVNKRRFHNSGNRFMRLAVQKLFGGKVRDVMTGYRALSYRFAKTIPVLSQNFEIETELTVYALENNLQVEEIAVNKGLVVEEPGRRFEKGYKEHLWESYNKYSHEDTEILIEVQPKYVEVRDTSDDGYAFQLFIDFENKTVEPKIYDKK